MKTTLEQTISETQRTCDDLISLLEKENKILMTGETTTLASIAHDKSTLLSLLSSLENNLGAGTSTKEFNNMKTDLHRSSKWKYLQQSLTRCRELNNRNGYIINTALANAHTSISVLRGQDQNNVETYSNNGINTQAFSSKTIAKI
jgi:flagellar biosynthesis/type III secretory pathway chaperone